jgi:aryl-alcohol dehydrogenase-like predicted oxidoreductase
MDYSTLHHFDYPISKIGFGCGPLSGQDWGYFDKKENMRAVSKAYELGVNIFDTADVYGLGMSEKLLSEALADKRHDVLISTKFGVNWGERPSSGLAKTFYDSSPKRVVKAIEDSLNRLKIDAIPLYYVHWPDPNTPFSETAEALQRCHESGKVKCFGLSNFSLEQINEFDKVLNISSVQAEYSLINNSIEGLFLDTCIEKGINVFSYGPLAQGLLTGKYDLNSVFDDDDCRKRLTHFHGANFKKYKKILNKIFDISNKYQITMSQVALRWVLENPNISCAISGVKSIAQIKDNTHALEFTIHPDDYEFFSRTPKGAL